MDSCMAKKLLRCLGVAAYYMDSRMAKKLMWLAHTAYTTACIHHCAAYTTWTLVGCMAKKLMWLHTLFITALHGEKVDAV